MGISKNLHYTISHILVYDNKFNLQNNILLNSSPSILDMAIDENNDIWILDKLPEPHAYVKYNLKGNKVNSFKEIPYDQSPGPRSGEAIQFPAKVFMKYYINKGRALCHYKNGEIIKDIRFEDIIIGIDAQENCYLAKYNNATHLYKIMIYDEKGKLLSVIPYDFGISFPYDMEMYNRQIFVGKKGDIYQIFDDYKKKRTVVQKTYRETDEIIKVKKREQKK